MSSPTPNTDIISTLLDSILHHILSFLPTKQSAATSILSKKWNQLWLSVLTLDFDDQGFPNFLAFRHFVFSVMLMRDTSSPIRSFRLKCGFIQGCNPYNINRFICAAVKRGIDDLTLDLSGTNVDFQIRLDPLISTVFNCRNLVVLKLKSLRVHVCPRFDFPQLETLQLDKVYFFGLSSGHFNKLIEACPILEELQVTDLRFGFPHLNNERSRSDQQVGRLSTSDFNWKYSFALVCNAKFMRFELITDQTVLHFHNLTHVELKFMRLLNWKLKRLLELLKYCLNLQDLTLHKLYKVEIDEHYLSERQNVPNCLSSKLRSCWLRGYEGTNCELQFAEYILKNAKVLDSMKISVSSGDLSLNVKHQMLMKLALCPRSSSTCKLSFE